MQKNRKNFDTPVHKLKKSNILKISTCQQARTTDKYNQSHNKSTMWK